jgi:V/A-type H+-transporting ATPase subunit K
MANVQFLGMACALGLSALGSGLGAGAACSAAVGGWKKCYANGKPAPFILVAFGGVPLTQTIYGFLLMTFIKNALSRSNPVDPLLAMSVGIFVASPLGFPPGCRASALPAHVTRFAEPAKYGELFHGHRYHRNRRVVHLGFQPVDAWLSRLTEQRLEEGPLQTQWPFPYHDLSRYPVSGNMR